MDGRSKGLLFVMIFSIIWALQIIMSKIALNNGASAFAFLFQIMIVAAIILLVYILIFQKNTLRLVHRQDMRKLLLIAFIGTAVANTLGYYGLEHSTSVSYGFLVKTAVFFTIVLSHFLIDEKIDSHKIILMIALLAGVYLITTKGVALVPNRFDILIVMSAFFYALANTVAKTVLRDIPADVVALFRLTFGAFFLLLLMPLFCRNFYVVVDYNLVIVTGILLAMMQIMLYRTLQITSACYLSMMSMATPLIVTIIGVFILKESFSAVQTVGGALIIVSGILIHGKDI